MRERTAHTTPKWPDLLILPLPLTLAQPPVRSTPRFDTVHCDRTTAHHAPPWPDFVLTLPSQWQGAVRKNRKETNLASLREDRK